jgi:hypothetical protein
VPLPPWGGGAVLYRQGRPQHYICVTWSADTAPHLEPVIGSHRWQTWYEFLTVALALTTWGDNYVNEGIDVLSDNSGALTDALHLKGTPAMLPISRELAWRKATRRWLFRVAHLPAEHNDEADTISRVHAPGSNTRSFPTALRNCVRVDPLMFSDFWALRQP